MIEPLHPDSIKELERAECPATDNERQALVEEFGFSYHSAIGELLYAYIFCRPDKGYAMAELSKFSQNPARCHYIAVKRVFRYLWQRKNWGLIYWRKKPRVDLPFVPFTKQSLEDSDLQFVEPEKYMQLNVYVDAAHVTDVKTRRSISGLVATINGTTIAYRAKWQTTVATSSTEAEFIAAVTAGKISKHLRFILDELGLKQSGPTAICEDNSAAILMANAGKPTERSRHIDIQYFALQEWVKNDMVKLFHIPVVANPVDSMKKALGWVLHTRHVTRLMGLCGNSYTNTSGRLQNG